MAKAQKLTDTTGTQSGWMIVCPACGNGHLFDQRWTFNGDVDRPTFTPSMLVREPGWPYVAKDRWLEVECSILKEQGGDGGEYRLRFHRDLVGDDCPADLAEVARRLNVPLNLDALLAATRGFNATLPGRVCHSFVTDGRIQFLGDCTHDMAGQTVDLPDFFAI